MNNAQRENTSFSKKNLLSQKNSTDTFHPHPAKQSVYSVIITTDIVDPFLKAAFDGDVHLLRERGDKEHNKAEETWNKYLLAFFLAVQNLQLKTANKIYRKYEFLRAIVQTLIYAHSRDPEFKTMIKLSANMVNMIQTIKDRPIEQLKDHLSSLSQEQNVKMNIVPKLNLKDAQNNKDQNMYSSIVHSSFDENTHLIKDPHAKTAKIVANSKIENMDEMFSHKNQAKTQIFESHAKNFFGVENDLIFLRSVFTSEVCRRFNSNVLKIALNMVEDRVAAFIVAKLPCNIDEQTVFYAIAHRCLIFLHKFSQENTDEDNDDYIQEDYIFTIEKLIVKVNDYFDFQNGENILKSILKWRFETSDNILRILCEIGHERVAARFMNEYPQFSNWEFFYYCVIHEKQYFLKHALRGQYFDEDYVYFNVFDLECIKLINQFSILGKMIIENLSFDDIEEIFMEKDFKDRPVLQIITSNEIMSFIVKSKLKYLLDKIWEGKYYSMVDGKISHFSQTQYLLHHRIKKFKGVTIDYKNILGASFRANCDDYNFIYQMIFREQSITLILLKDFICASVMVFVFQYINYSYLVLFTMRRYQDAATYEDQVKIISNNLLQYKQVNFLGSILSVSYLMGLVQRVIYNQYAKKKLDLDLWLLLDIFAGITNLVAFNIIGNAKPSQMIETQSKWSLDYFMILILLTSWFRYFSYFMIINSVARVTLTLFRMMQETLSFFIILTSYLILMATIFAICFKDANTPDAEPYENIFSTIREMVDYFIGNYTTKQMGNYQTSHSVLVIVHVVISYIFFMNYLIAILSTVYEIMIRNGDFYSTQYSYIFVSKYIKALNENNGYEKLILYSPPLNFLLIPLIIVSPNQYASKKVSKYLGKLFFWLENMFLLISFFLYLVFIDMIVFIKILYQLTHIKGQEKYMHMILWFFLGLIYLLYVNLVDTCTLFNILCFEKSISFENEEEEKKKIQLHKFYIYRDCIRAIKQLYEIAENTSIVFNKKQMFLKLMTSKDVRKKVQKQDFQQEIDDTYIIEKELIIQTYAQIANSNKYTQQYRQKYYTLVKGKSNQSFFSTIETGLISQRDQLFTEPSLSMEFKNFVSDIMLTNRRDPTQFDVGMTIKAKSVMQLNQMTKDEEKLVRNFLHRFEHFNKGQQNSSINLLLVVKAFPQIFTPIHVKKIELVNFQKMQKVLIKFYNDDKDEMFNYYDMRMKSRFKSLKSNQDTNNDLVKSMRSVSLYIQEFVEKVLEKKPQQSSSNKLLRPYIFPAPQNHSDIIRNFSFQQRQSENSLISKQWPGIPQNQQKIAQHPDTIQTELDSIKEENSENRRTPTQKKSSPYFQMGREQDILQLDTLYNPFSSQYPPNFNQMRPDSSNTNKTGVDSYSTSPGNRILAEAQLKIKEEVNAFSHKANELKKKRKHNILQKYVENQVRQQSSKFKNDYDSFSDQ